MRKGKVYISDYPENPPDWYWTAGLHDACIIGVEALEFPFDYNSFVKDKRNDNRNLLTFKINASGALFNTAVREIRLFNYKVLSKDIEIQGRRKIWWLADRLTEKDNHFVLEVNMIDLDSDPEEFIFIIQFERAEVDRL